MNKHEKFSVKLKDSIVVESKLIKTNMYVLKKSYKPLNSMLCSKPIK